MPRCPIRPLGALAVCLLCPTLASAGDDPQGDGHYPPPEYAAPGWSMPPVSFEAPEYPLAAQFIEADASNFTNGGLDVIEHIVVHTMQGSYEGSINWFLNPVSDVSAHFCVRSEDGEITQMVHLDDKAWHVGSENPWAIGIEHEGFVDDASWYTFAMYDQSSKLARWLADHFALPLDRDHILGHVELPNQTHTDPGANWNWDLYMALIHELVGDGVIEGVVVDPDRACVLTASVDTTLTRTLDDAAAQADDAKCVVPAGTALEYLHAGDDRVGRRHLVLADDGPCAALGQGFAVAADFAGFCAPEDLAVAGASVTLDGGAPIVVAADGAFSWTGVAAGAHTIDASATEFEPASLPVDHAGYPGLRVVVRLPSVASGDTTGSAPPTDDTGIPPGDGDGSSGSATTGDAGDDGTGAGTDGDEPALPGTFGESESASGCGCTAQGGRTGAWWLLVVAGPLAGRRRSTRRSPSPAVRL